MFTTKTQDTDPDLNVPINKVLDSLQTFSPESNEYAKAIKQLDKLYKLKHMNQPEPISANTMLIVGANLVGIVLIVGHERANVIASKALNFVFKLR